MKHQSALIILIFILFTREMVRNTVKVGSIPALAFGVWQGGLLCMYFYKTDGHSDCTKDGLIPGRTDKKNELIGLVLGKFFLPTFDCSLGKVVLKFILQVLTVAKPRLAHTPHIV